MATDDDGFIGRWARRKAENNAPGGLQKKAPEVAAPVRGRMITEPLPVKTPDDEKAKELEVASVSSGSPLVESEPQDPAIKTDEVEELDLEELENIDIEALDYDADFTKFMQAGVPERLRQRALRRLWGSNPILANVDGLNDYDEDYTDAALAVDVLKTAWKVGQGYLTDEEVAERDAERLEEDRKAREENPAAPSIAAEDAQGGALDNPPPEAVAITSHSPVDEDLIQASNTSAELQTTDQDKDTDLETDEA